MSIIKVGVIGIGNMGTSHALQLDQGKVEGARVTAVCDLRESQLAWAKENLSNEVQRFSNVEDFFKKAEIDAVLIATPHYDHPSLAIQSFEKGWHVLVEKPAGVFTKNVQEMNEVAKQDRKSVV